GKPVTAQASSCRREPVSSSRGEAPRVTKTGTPAFAGRQRVRWLAAEQFLLLIDIFLGDVPSGDQRVDAGLGHVSGILLEADVEELAADSVLVAELVVLPGQSWIRLGSIRG